MNLPPNDDVLDALQKVTRQVEAAVTAGQVAQYMEVPTATLTVPLFRLNGSGFVSATVEAGIPRYMLTPAGFQRLKVLGGADR